MRRTGPTNIVLRKIIRELRVYANRYKAPIWDAVADYLMRSSRKRVVVNLSKISRYARDGDVIVVPGKVLGGGDLKKKVVIAAFSFSKTALEKIRISGSKPMTIKDLLKENPEGRGVRIFA
ncbi:MAG: 50S ribosomal protein L18e [Desulfurococcales archaeon]|jgi:large subunit ribosomal protein L18e|nr:50S ribosomal protein L18e [Desulfurococcales archaeon]